MELTENRKLRGGRPSWQATCDNIFKSDSRLPQTTDIAIIGAGVMGAMLADRLSAQARQVVLLDRRQPAFGSTAASTALVMWAADVPLTHLARTIGEVEASRRWRRIFKAVRDLADYIDHTGLDCDRRDRPELYLAGSLLDEHQLASEGEARRSVGLPSEYLDADTVAARFGIAPRAALISTGVYEVDPVKLTIGLLTRARRRGARVYFPFDVTRIEQRGEMSVLHGHNGETVIAANVIIASGYERASWFLPDDFKIGSSYAIATPAATAPLWRENAMIWEASSPYLYTRATADGRVIAGGEDESFDDAQRRDALIGEKSGTIAAKLASVIDTQSIAVDYAWAAAFGSSPDGLPAIGQARNHEKLWLASGFGGNGVSFAGLAAEIIATALDGGADEDAACFDPYRFATPRSLPE